MIEETTILEAKLVYYYSECDEAAFFEWLDKITCVESYRGQHDTLYITLKNKKIKKECLRELLALFHRYKINVAQLDNIIPEKYKAWLADIFGDVNGSLPQA